MILPYIALIIGPDDGEGDGDDDDDDGEGDCEWLGN